MSENACIFSPVHVLNLLLPFCSAADLNKLKAAGITSVIGVIMTHTKVSAFVPRNVGFLFFVFFSTPTMQTEIASGQGHLAGQARQGILLVSNFHTAE
jgi:hypothetical protein